MKALSILLQVIGGFLLLSGFVMKRLITAESLEPIGGRGAILVAFLFGGLIFGAGYLLMRRIDRTVAKDDVNEEATV